MWDCDFAYNPVKRKWIIAIAVGLILACAYIFFPTSTQGDVVSGIFGGKGNYDAFEAANAATVQRVHFENETNGDNGVLKEYGYRHEAPFVLSNEQREELKKLLSDPHSYNWRTSYDCIPEYAMVVHFQSSNVVISVAFCLKCKQLLVLDSTYVPAQALNAEDNFSPVLKQVVALAKNLFPKDSEIQALR